MGKKKKVAKQAQPQSPDRIEMYKLIAQILVTRTYRLEEVAAVQPAFEYLKREIEAHVPAEATNDSGSQG